MHSISPTALQSPADRITYPIPGGGDVERPTDLSCNTESQGRVPGQKAHQGWRRKLGNPVSLYLGTKVIFGPTTHAWFWKRQQLIIALTTAEQIFEERTKIRRQLWQCLNVVRAQRRATDPRTECEYLFGLPEQHVGNNAFSLQERRGALYPLSVSLPPVYIGCNVTGKKDTHFTSNERGWESACSSFMAAVRHPWQNPCTHQQGMISVHHSAGEAGTDALLELLFILVPRINSVNSSELLKIALDEHLTG